MSGRGEPRPRNRTRDSVECLEGKITKTEGRVVRSYRGQEGIAEKGDATRVGGRKRE